MNDRTLKKLQKILFTRDIGISYNPLSDETDPLSNPLLNKAMEKASSAVIVPKDSTRSPVNFAASLKPDFKKTAFILIPGQCFDKEGARRGRGNGWYDRFLSRVPKNWIRIGVTNKKYFSRTPLNQNSWDEPMDWVMCERNKMWTLYKTGARIKNPS